MNNINENDTINNNEVETAINIFLSPVSTEKKVLLLSHFSTDILKEASSRAKTQYTMKEVYKMGWESAKEFEDTTYDLAITKYNLDYLASKIYLCANDVNESAEEFLQFLHPELTSIEHYKANMKDLFELIRNLKDSLIDLSSDCKKLNENIVSLACGLDDVAYYNRLFEEETDLQEN